MFESVNSDTKIKLAEVKGHGKLTAQVIETRQSHHIGDLYHGFFPQTPKVGDQIVLGEGDLFYEDEYTVGLHPDDQRDHFWLNPESLYKVHDQTVRLVFERSTEH